MEEVSYSCVELYLKFVTCFMDEATLSKEIIERLKRTKMKSERDDIEEISEPSFLIEADTNNIERANSQALKFLRARRVDIKDKDFSSFIIPNLKVQELNKHIQRNSEKTDEFPVFFKNHIGDTVVTRCRNITMSSKVVNNRPYFIITAHKRTFSNSCLDLFMNSQMELVASSQDYLLLNQKNGKERRRVSIA